MSESRHKRRALVALMILAVASAAACGGSEDGPADPAEDTLGDIEDTGTAADVPGPDLTPDGDPPGDTATDQTAEDAEDASDAGGDTDGSEKDAGADTTADVPDDGTGDALEDATGDTTEDTGDGAVSDVDAGPTEDVGDGGDGEADADAGPASCTSDEDCLPENTCMLGTCDTETGTCTETPLPEGSFCEDGNLCSIGDTCTAEGWCMGLQAINCNDQNPCTDDTCDPATGCVLKNNFAACDDGDPCTVGEQCNGGTCTGSVPLCDDDNPCTDDSCDGETGACDNTPDDGLTCSDGSECTEGDACVSGTCVAGEADGCDDGNPCTADTCEAETTCVSVIQDGADCEDGDACTVGDLCDNDTCVAGEAADCDDQNSCTATGCDPGSGCTVTFLEFAACDDEDACSITSQCDAVGDCVEVVGLVCDDENGCTEDSCDPATGCVFDATSDPCDDANECTIADTCQADGGCLGIPADCDDEDACTEDSCDVATGCVNVDVSADCESDNPCLDAACDPAVGCTSVFNVAACDDEDACTGPDVCAEGECVGGAIPCDDEDVCTVDSCDVTDGCQFVAADIPCDDGNACTVGEACEELDPQCDGGDALDVDDGVDCTLDSCDPEIGAVHTPNAADCAVGQACDPASGCVPGTVSMVISKFSLAPTDPVDNGQGQWIAMTNVGDTLVDVSSYFVLNGSGHLALITATSGAGAPVLVAPGETVAGIKSPSADPPVDPGPFAFTFDNGPGTFSWDPTGDTIEVRDQGNDTIDKLNFTGVSSGPMDDDDHLPSVLGLATELDREAVQAATDQFDNDDALMWCAWDGDGSDPTGEHIDCERVRVNEVALAGGEGERFIELHMPFGGQTGAIEIRQLDLNGAVTQALQIANDRMPVGSALVYTDGVEGVTWSLLSSGSVQCVRDGALLDAYGFGNLNAEVAPESGLALYEGTAGPNGEAGKSAARAAPGVDSDDNAADFVVGDGTPGTL